jgi:predicted aspartyl protease
MGVFTITAKVYTNFPNGERAPAELELLVDTGATFSVIPRETLVRVGVKPVEKREILTVDRKLLRRDLGYVGIEVAGRRVLSPVLFGDGDDFAVLGAVTMEIAGLVVDPERKTLEPRPSLLL